MPSEIARGVAFSEWVVVFGALDVLVVGATWAWEWSWSLVRPGLVGVVLGVSRELTTSFKRTVNVLPLLT